MAGTFKYIWPGPSSTIWKAFAYYASDLSLNTDETSFAPVAINRATPLFWIHYSTRKTGFCKKETLHSLGHVKGNIAQINLSYEGCALRQVDACLQVIYSTTRIYSHKTCNLLRHQLRRLKLWWSNCDGITTKITGQDKRDCNKQ